MGRSRSETVALAATGDSLEALPEFFGRRREGRGLRDRHAGCSAANFAERLSRDFSPEAIFFWSSMTPRISCSGVGGTARHVDVDGNDLVDPLGHVVGPVEAARGRAHAHRDDPLGLGHLVVDLPQHRGELVRHGARDDQEVGLARGETDDLRPEPGDVVVRGERPT